MKWDELSERERDALIHEKVMGKTEPEICEFDPSMTVMTSGSEPDSFDWHCYKCEAHGKVTRDGYYQHPKAIPRYTTSMDAAWQVLQKTIDNGRGYASMTLYHGDGYLEIDVHLQDEHRYLPPVHVEQANLPAPEIICVAALRACGVEIE